MTIRMLTGLAAGLMCAAGARADFDGRTIGAEWRDPMLASVVERHTVVAGEGVELGAADLFNTDAFSIDIAGDTVTFRFERAVSWAGVDHSVWTFADVLGEVPEIVGYDVAARSDGLVNFGRLTTGFDADRVWSDFGGLEAGAGDFVTLRARFVPAPGSLAALGLGGLLAARRRR